MATPAANSKPKSAKLVLLGEAGAGKSSLVLRFVKDQFVEFQESTIGAAFFTQMVTLDEGTVKLDIWDTAGQERYQSLAPMYYRTAAGAVVVYDITNAATFARAKKWVQELRAQGSADVVIALAGNKADLVEARQVSSEEARTYAQENGIIFMETSAKTATNVNDIFHGVARKIIQAPSAEERRGVSLADGPPQKAASAATCCSS